VTALALCFALGCGASSKRESDDGVPGGSSQGGSSGSSSIDGASCVSDGVEYPSGSLVVFDCNSCTCIDGMLRDCTTETCPDSPLRCEHYSQCPVSQACIVPSCRGIGVCVNTSACPGAGDPVCGCYGATLGSRCAAQAQSGNVAHTGACAARSCNVDGRVEESATAWSAGDGCNYCECIDGEVFCTERSCTPCGEGLDPCADDEYCAFGGTSCGADGPGSCTLRPNNSCMIEAGPVCGCDGQTYMNHCYAAKAGQSVAASGFCESAP